MSGLAANEGVGQAGPLGLLIVLLLAVALIFLIRSLNKQLRRMPTRFDPELQERQRRRTPPDEPEGPGA